MVLNNDAVLSNRGPCNFLVKADGKKRRFELTETFYGVGDQAGNVCFHNFLVSVRDKFCWSVTHRTDVISPKEGLIYANCIREVLASIDLS